MESGYQRLKNKTLNFYSKLSQYQKECFNDIIEEIDDMAWLEDIQIWIENYERDKILQTE